MSKKFTEEISGIIEIVGLLLFLAIFEGPLLAAIVYIWSIMPSILSTSLASLILKDILWFALGLLAILIIGAFGLIIGQAIFLGIIELINKKKNAD